MSNDADRLVSYITSEVRELHALVQVLKSATIPSPQVPTEPAYMLAPLVATINGHVQALLNVIEPERVLEPEHHQPTIKVHHE